MVLRIATLVALGVVAALPAYARGGWLPPCAADRLVYSWIHQGFERTDEIYDPPRHPNGNHIRFVGELRARGRTYRIYFDQGSNPQTQHGHQDVIVLSGGGKYLGFYEINDTLLEPLATRGAEILFEPFEDDPHNHDSARIQFGADGPPLKIDLNGHDLSFDTPGDFPKDSRDTKRRPEPAARVQSYCQRRR